MFCGAADDRGALWSRGRGMAARGRMAGRARCWRSPRAPCRSTPMAWGVAMVAGGAAAGAAAQRHGGPLGSSPAIFWQSISALLERLDAGATHMVGRTLC